MEIELGILKGAIGGALLFEWEPGGSKHVRTVVVQEFHGVLIRLKSGNIVQFRTEINKSGLDASDVRKIRRATRRDEDTTNCRGFGDGP